MASSVYLDNRSSSIHVVKYISWHSAINVSNCILCSLNSLLNTRALTSQEFLRCICQEPGAEIHNTQFFIIDVSRLPSQSIISKNTNSRLFF